MVSYYVDSEIGNDLDSGISEYKPLRSLDGVRKLRLNSGDRVLFRRDREFIGSLSNLQIYHSNIAKKIEFSAYGSGFRPRLIGYSSIPRNSWSILCKTIWTCAVSIKKNISQNILLESKNYNIAFLQVDGVIKGKRVFTLQDMKSDWDFFISIRTGEIYVRFSGNINSDFDRILIASQENAISPATGTKYTEIDFMGFGGHGISIYNSNVIVSSCGFYGIGGAVLGNSLSRMRYGNGAQVWIGANDVLIENCIFEDVYDAAFTMQGQQSSRLESGWRNVVFRSNDVVRSFQAIEFWNRQFFEKNSSNNHEIFVSNCRVYNNRFMEMQNSWSGKVRPDTNVSAAFLFYDISSKINEISIFENIFEGMRNLVYSNDKKIPSGIDIFNNTFMLTHNTYKIFSWLKYDLCGLNLPRAELDIINSNSIKRVNR